MRSDVRGRFAIGPMAVRLSDPFGLVELRRHVHRTATAGRDAAGRAAAADPAGAATGPAPATTGRAPFAAGSAEDVTVREYRRGDDLRRVHWR